MYQFVSNFQFLIWSLIQFADASISALNFKLAQLCDQNEPCLAEENMSTS